MVCKECGAYNAEHLTHCRVCAAKLKDTEPAAEQTAQEPGRPSRRFAQAPAWPKQAFEGASTAPEAPAAEPEAEPVFTAAAEPAAPKAEPVAPAAPVTPKAAPVAPKAEEPKLFCASCGKPLLPDAPFCAYCGARADAPSAPAAAAAAPADEGGQPAGRMNAASRRFGKRAEKAPEPPKEDYADLYADDVDEFDDDEYDEDLYEDEEEPVHAKGGKGSTILFWGLIVVLVLLIGGLGWYVVNKNGGFDAVLGNLFGGGSATPTPPVLNGGSTPDLNTTVNVDGMSASIEPATLQDGSEGFRITINAPTGSVVHIITEAPLQSDTAEITQGNALTLEVPKAVFLPYDYADTDTVSVTPQLEITTPDGKVTPLSVPAVTVTLDRLNLTITEPAALTTEQKADNGPITVAGTVDDHTVEVLVNGTAVPVYEGGQFQTEVVMEDDVETGGQIVVTARKINAVTATQTIVVTPYVVKDLALTVTTEVKNLRAEKDSVTVDGTVTAGATVKVTCASDKVTCGETIVTANGTFSCPITIKEDGFYELTITGTLEGYNEGKASCFVERAPSNANTFKKACTNITKVYDKLVDGSTTSGNLVLTGKIKEIVATSPYTIVKVELSDGKQVMVCNRSLKNTLAEDDINRTKEIAGVYAGLYPDTQLPYVWGWFIWNK